MHGREDGRMWRKEAGGTHLGIDVGAHVSEHLHRVEVALRRKVSERYHKASCDRWIDHVNIPARRPR
jgi:hypothetical protein